MPEQEIEQPSLRAGRTPQHRPGLGRRLGLNPRVTKTNLGAFLVHCSCSILFLVYLNSSQPFVIHQLSHDHHDAPQRAGSLSGTLIFWDELLSAALALFWGATADIFGFHTVAATGYIFIALGLVAFTVPSSPWPGLLVARLIFAVGGSAVTAMLSGVLADFSSPAQDQDPGTMTQHGIVSDDQLPESRAESEITVRPQAEQDEVPHLQPASGPVTESAPSAFPTSKPKAKHGQLAALAGVFTGLGALLAVFGLLRIPERLAKYLDSRATGRGPGRSGDINVRRATVATFWIVAAISLLAAVVMAFGLRPSPAGMRSSSSRFNDTYGATRDSSTTVHSDPREARRARLRRRLARREGEAWIPRLKQAARDYRHGTVGGLKLATLVHRRVGVETREHQRKKELARELRMAYLGGALARAFTIATTAFLPLLIAHHYYTSGLCRNLPSPDPNSPLPPDSLKQLCRRAFTATSIVGGTTQLAALLFAPLIGFMCDRITPTLTLALTSSIGAAGLVVLGVGTGGNVADPRTGEEVPNPLTTVSILAAIAVGFGQIGAIVASLASCARGRSLLAPEPVDGNTTEEDTLLPPQRTRTRPTKAAQTGAGAIAGAYTCIGSLSILVVSKLGGFLFDLYPPSPFLLVAGLSAFVSLAGFTSSLLYWCTRRT